MKNVFRSMEDIKYVITYDSITILFFFEILEVKMGNMSFQIEIFFVATCLSLPGRSLKQSTSPFFSKISDWDTMGRTLISI